MKKNIISCDWLPPYYPKQPFFRFCSHFQIATIAQARGMRLDRKSIFNGGIQDILGFCTPGQLGKKMQLLFTDVSIETGGTVQRLKTLIDENRCCVLFIAHGYNQECQGFNPVKGVFFQHYISVWGYNDKGFFVYDSSLSSQNTEGCIGNGLIDFVLLERCRKRGGLGLWNNFFITVSKS